MSFTHAIAAKKRYRAAVERAKARAAAGITDPPDAPAILVGRQWVVLICPYCGRKHYHGGPSLGHRSAHCALPLNLTAGGYVLVAAP